MPQQFTMNPRVPDGTVVIMGVRYEGMTSDKIFTYVWLKAAGLWYSTGNAKTPTAAGWPAVERWLARDGRVVEWVEVVTATERVYPPRIEGEQATQVIVDEEPSWYDRPHR